MGKPKTEFPWKNPGTALVTGASSGLGKVFAQQLAQMGFSLILVARREDRLREIARELETSAKVRVEVFAADLIREGDVAKIKARIEACPDLDVLVNNAGFGSKGMFASNDFNRQLEMIQVHNLAPVYLMRAALPGMIARHRGAIINLSSLGGYLPTGGSVMYAATKSFIRMFTESLALELEGTGVLVEALCPGFTFTEFHEVGELQGFDRKSIPKGMWMPAEPVIRAALEGLTKGQIVVVPGFKNRLMRWLVTSHVFGGFAKRVSNTSIKKRNIGSAGTSPP
jgi:short-subunit dehydrogenase